MVLLETGCLCCTMRGDLVDALEQLLRDLDNGRAGVPPRGDRDHRPRRSRAGPADHDGASLSRSCASGSTAWSPWSTRSTARRRSTRTSEAVKQVAVADRHRARPRPTSSPRRTRHARRGRPVAAAAHAQSGGADPRCRGQGEATPRRLLDCGLYDPAAQDSRRQALARSRSLCRGAGRPATITTITGRRSGHARRQPPRRSHPRLLVRHRRGDPGRACSTCSSSSCARCTARTCCGSRAS